MILKRVEDVRIEIRRGRTNAVIISFDTHSQKFESASERNKFFHGLYGWEQRVPGNDRVYRYWRSGVLDDVPHVRISGSVFAVAADHMEKIARYFEEWEDKIEFEMFDVLMEMDRFLNEERVRDKLRRNG